MVQAHFGMYMQQNTHCFFFCFVLFCFFLFICFFDSQDHSEFTGLEPVCFFFFFFFLRQSCKSIQTLELVKTGGMKKTVVFATSTHELSKSGEVLTLLNTKIRKFLHFLFLTI